MVSSHEIARCKSKKTWANIRRNGDEACEKAPINTGGYTTELGDMHAPTTMWLRGRSRFRPPSMQRHRAPVCSKPVEKWRTPEQKPWSNDTEGDRGEKTEEKLVVSGQVPAGDDFEAREAPARHGAHRRVRNTIARGESKKTWARIRKNGDAACRKGR